MDDLIFPAIKLMCFAAALAVIVMIVNRLRGKDELNDLFSRKKKDNKK